MPHGPSRRWVGTLATSLAVCMGVQQCDGAPVGASDDDPSVRITSPLGRTGLPGTIRIVVRVDGTTEAPLRVHFLVDGQLLSSDMDGPPYEAMWSDENPFERRELAARAELESGVVLTTTSVLEPLEVTEVTEVTSVALDMSVLTEKGQFVRGLQTSDFQVVENGEAQEIDALVPFRDPALFAVLVDSSQSMASRAAELRRAAMRMLEPLAPEDEVVVAPFARRILQLTGPTVDRRTALEAMSDIRPSGGTAILDALQEAARGLSRTSRRKAIVLLTDGYDEHSQSSYEATVETLKNADVPVYVIGVGGVAGMSLKGEDLLSALAGATGGRAWFPMDSRRLLLAYEAVVSDVQHRYLLTYTPKNQRRDGTYRSIQVSTSQGYAVRTRTGYRAPQAPPVRALVEFTAFATGRAPLALSPADLEVVEDGVRQAVDTFHESVLPVTIMLALDASGSMRRSAQAAQDAAREFVGALRPEDEVGMILFADKARYIHSPTTRRDWSLAAIDTYTPEGGTALYDALHDALAQVAVAKGRRVVVVVTDGLDENAASTGPGSQHSWTEVLALAERTEAVVYPIGIGTRVDSQRLRQLADASGGSAFFPRDVSELSADYRKVLDELRRRYAVGYSSSNLARDGQWRRVDIQVHQEGATVRSRGGYYAPAQ